jgi:SH3-like domain-containing protein
MRSGAVIAACVFLATGTAAAEKVKTNQKTKMYAHPGEMGAVIKTVKTGQMMTLLNKEGRWLKVRFEGLTGYIPRSKVDLPDDDDAIPRNTRRRPFVDGRSTQRVAGGEGPDDRVGADAVGDGDDGTPKGKPKPNDDVDDDKPTNKTSKNKATNKPSDDDDDGGGKVASKGKTTKGKDKGDKDKGDKDKGDKDKGDKDDGGDDDSGDKGKDKDDGGDDKVADTRPKTHVTVHAKIYSEANKSSDVAFTAEPEQELYIEGSKGKWTEVSLAEGDIGWVLTSKLDLDSSGGDGSGITKRTIDTNAALGASFINQGLRTAGSARLTPPDNYNIASAAGTLNLDADILFPYKTNFIVGGEAVYQLDAALPGVAFDGKTTGITIHQFDLRAVGGYDLHNSKGMVVWAHLGFRYQAYLVSNVTNPADNTAQIPSEVFTAPTIGGGLTIARLTPKIAVRGMLDLAALGTHLSQTKNLDDGLSPHETEVIFGLQGTYRYKPGLDLQAMYGLTYGAASFGAVDPNSERQHMGTAVTRTDIFHTFAVGIAKRF